MTVEEILKAIKSKRNGTFRRITFYANPYPLAKGKDKDIKKVCTAVVRFGITYSHLKENANKETGGLNGKVWKDGETNYVLISEKTGEELIRVYTTNHHKVRSKWYLNGEETTKESLIEERLVSDRKSSKTACFDLKVSNIISIG